MPKRTRVVQRDETTVISRVNRRPAYEKVVDDITTTKPGGKMER